MTDECVSSSWLELESDPGWLFVQFRKFLKKIANNSKLNQKIRFIYFVDRRFWRQRRSS